MTSAAAEATGGEPPWEPPLAGPEAAQLLGAIDRQRWTLRWKADGLDEDGLRHTVGVSALTLGGLLHHLALVEDASVGGKLAGRSLPDEWAEADWDEDPDWEITAAATMPAAELYRRYDAAVERSRALLGEVLADGDLDRRAAMSDQVGELVTARRVLTDLLEEYARHVGHADLLRESVDGRVGEDPPEAWRPARFD